MFCLVNNDLFSYLAAVDCTTVADVTAISDTNSKRVANHNIGSKYVTAPGVGFIIVIEEADRVVQRQRC